MALKPSTTTAEDQAVKDQQSLTSSVDPNQVPSDPNKEPLSPNSKDPQTDASTQAAADRNLDASRGTQFGDNTSSRGESNTPGQHGRDGGVRGAPEGGGPNNPVPSEQTINPIPTDENDPNADNSKV